MIFNTVVSGGGGGQSGVPITLRASDWINNKQTITVEGVSADPAICYPCINVVSPAYVESGITFKQGTNFLVFSCQSVPTVDIHIKVSIVYSTGGNSISNLTIQFTYSGAYDWFDEHTVRLLTSGTFIPAIDMENATVQVVGGGGGGGRGSSADYASTSIAAGGGGGAGYSSVNFEIAMTTGTEYPCIIGSGGGPGAAGGTSTAFEVSANGGGAGGLGTGGTGSASGGTSPSGSWSESVNGGNGQAGNIYILGNPNLPTIGDGGGAGARYSASGGSGNSYGGRGGSQSNSAGDGQPWTGSGGGGGSWYYREMRGFGGSGGCGVIYISHEFLQRPVIK